MNELSRNYHQDHDDEPLSADQTRSRGTTIRVCKSDAKGGHSFFTYESPEGTKTASRFAPDDSLPFFGGQNGGPEPRHHHQKQMTLPQPGVHGEAQAQFVLRDMTSALPQKKALTKAEIKQMHSQEQSRSTHPKSKASAPQKQKPQAAAKHGRKVYQITPKELSKMSANLSNLANEFGDGDTTYEDINSGHYPSYFELAKGQGGVPKGPPSALDQSAHKY